MVYIRSIARLFLKFSTERNGTAHTRYIAAVSVYLIYIFAQSALVNEMKLRIKFRGQAHNLRPLTQPRRN